MIPLVQPFSPYRPSPIHLPQAPRKDAAVAVAGAAVVLVPFALALTSSAAVNQLGVCEEA
jgi:hypothetical protein